MLTYQTTRAVKCVYFDGESATLFGTGQLDSQMLHVFGNTTGPPPSPDRVGLWYEYARAVGLCDWLKEKGLGGPGWGYEGIVRMNAGFEMIWCNFTSPSLRLISHLNVTTPLLPAEKDKDVESIADAKTTTYFPLPPIPTRTDKAIGPSDPPLPPNWRRYITREPFLESQSWDWFLSSASHYGPTGAGAGQGESRIKILSCGFLSYYSPTFSGPALARAEREQISLNLTKGGLWMGPGDDGTRSVGLTMLTRRRRAHTLVAVSEFDAGVMKKDSEKALFDLLHGSSNCSGMDWTSLANKIVRTYSGPLSELLKLIQKYDGNIMSNQTAVREWMDSIRERSHSFLIPFLQYPNEFPKDTIRATSSALFRETYSRCRFHYTRLLDPEEGFTLSSEELNLRWAVEETMSGICNILVDVGLNVEGMWQHRFNPQSEVVGLEAFNAEVQRWAEGIEELMAWLGWGSDWIWCEEQCKWDEKCFIPMWPLMPFRGGYRPEPPYNHSRPGYEGPKKPGFIGTPSNGTDRSRRGGRWVMSDETDLWSPKCVKSDYFSF